MDAGSAFNNLSGGTWNFSGTTITGVRLFADNNSNTFNYNLAGPQTIITPVDAYSNLTLSGSGAKTAAASFAVRGNWTRAGATYANGGFRISLTGTQSQTVSATGGETFANLTINNTSATSPQITFNNPVTVSTNVTMTAGNINLNGNSLTLSASGVGALTHSLMGSGGWMYGGSLNRAIPKSIAVGTLAGFYPLGGSANFRPFFLGKANTNPNSGTVTVQHTDANTVTDIVFTDGVAIITRRHDSFWTVSTTFAGGTFDITAGGTGYTIGAISDIHLTKASDALNIGTAAASSGNTTDVRASRTTLTSGQLVNNFYIASTNTASSPLPIELAYFRARLEGDVVAMDWKTLQEINNQEFTVQKTTDFETFYDVGVLPGQGTSKEIHAYSLLDTSPSHGKSYYRLKQMDFDGKTSFSAPVMIDYDRVSSFLEVYPSPFHGTEISIAVKALKDVPEIPVIMMNDQGQVVMRVVIQRDAAGNLKQKIIFPEALPAGLYLFRAGPTIQLTRKVLVN